MHFTEYLRTIGYKSYIFDVERLVKSKNFIHSMDYYREVSVTSHYSTYGPLDYRWIKDGDFKNQIIYGLSEGGKPPSLIGEYHYKDWDDKLTQQENNDRMLRDLTNEEIYEVVVKRLDELHKLKQ